jgi:hypothetical protein
MVDIVLQTPELDVFGGPASLNVSTDFGKTGERGTRTWVGNGDPLLTLVNQDIKLYDLYINTNSSPDVYGWLYQYIPNVGSPTWEQVLRLNPQQYSAISSVPFDDGEGTLNIPVSVITRDASPQTSGFIIRNSFENSSGYPVASSFTYDVKDIIGVKYISIVLNAAAFDGSDWNSLQGSHKVHSFVSYLG